MTPGMSDCLLRRTLLPGLVDADIQLVSNASLGALERAGEHEIDQLNIIITAWPAAPPLVSPPVWTWAMSATGRCSTGTRVSITRLLLREQDVHRASIGRAVWQLEASKPGRSQPGAASLASQVSPP